MNHAAITNPQRRRDSMSDESWVQYRSHDLGLASSLECEGYPIVEIERTDDRRVEFIFARTPMLMDTVSKYWGNKLRQNPREYFEALRSIKSRLHSAE